MGMKIKFPNADLCYIPRFFSAEKSDFLFEYLYHNLAWRPGRVFVFGQWHDIPRLQAFYADEALSYKYSGKRLYGLPWETELLDIKQCLLNEGIDTNALLANLYRNGHDKMGWHRDNEPELGTNPSIASLSFGAEREFQLRHRDTKQRHTILLEHGSLLLMQGTTQQYWEHQLPVQAKCLSPRVNLTFRKIIHT